MGILFILYVICGAGLAIGHWAVEVSDGAEDKAAVFFGALGVFIAGPLVFALLFIYSCGSWLVSSLELETLFRWTFRRSRYKAMPHVKLMQLHDKYSKRWAAEPKKYVLKRYWARKIFKLNKFLPNEER